MTQESVTYLTNIGISVVLAAMLTHSWVSKGHKGPMGFWMTAAWMMVTTNCLFAARPLLADWFGRIGPTLLVTVALGIILLGAQVTAARRPAFGFIGILVIVHAALLLHFFMLDERTHWRTATNGVIWAGLSAGAFAAFRQATHFFWKSIFSPANVVLLHAIFHLMRLTLSILAGEFDWGGVAESMQLLGDLEASVFIVAIYVSILVSTMRKDDEELANARVEMATLSGLLPICAWCKKVRDDDGYWRQVEEYLKLHTHVDFTHSICSSCESRFIEESKRKGELPPDSAPGVN